MDDRVGIERHDIAANASSHHRVLVCRKSQRLLILYEHDGQVDIVEWAWVGGVVGEEYFECKAALRGRDGLQASARQFRCAMVDNADAEAKCHLHFQCGSRASG